MNINQVKKVIIYPSLGIARIGNSPEFFLASDIPGKAPEPEGGSYKDGNNLFKKQVPRFRIYAFDENDKPLGELTADDATIEWRVHIANRKAGWYQFNNALDLGKYAKNSAFRNVNVTGTSRDQLIIDPGTRTISGKNQQGEKYRFDSGTFYEKQVPLGEIRTDDKGRLLVFGGDGSSASHTGAPATTFANNDGWHDDVSDGTVRALVTINGAQLEAEPAMVACTPPNFGPGLFSVVTMYDVVYDLYVREKWVPSPGQITFYEHIFPMLQRMCSAQWVNEGFFMLFGVNSPSDFTQPDYLKKLSSPGPEYQQERIRVFKWFRNTNSPDYQPALIPPYYGDLFGDYTNLPHVDLSVPETQYGWLERWAEGDFTTGTPQKDKPFEQLTVEEQIAALEKAPLEECLGGPFHPGIEITWPFRNLIMWEKPFRLKVLPEDKPVSDNYGPILTPEIALAPGGPIDGSGPGSLTRWLGVPWQTDEASCLSGYDATLYLPLPSFWAARVPNYVLSKDSFDRSTKESLNTGQRLKHFSYRVDWLRDLGTQYAKRINAMVANWHQLGVVTKQETAPQGADGMLPVEWWVETDRYTPPGFDPTYQQVLIAEGEMEPIPVVAGLAAVDGEERIEEQPRESRAVRRDER